MFITQEVAELREKSSGNLIKKLEDLREQDSVLIVEDKFKNFHGNDTGGKGINTETRELIGIAAHFGARKEVAEQFGVTERTVDRAKSAQYATENGNGVRVDEEQRDRIQEIVSGKKADIVDRALSKMLEGIIGLDFNDNGAKTRSEITKNLSGIVRNLSGAEGSKTDNRVQVVVVNPGMRQVKDYDTVDV